MLKITYTTLNPTVYPKQHNINCNYSNLITIPISVYILPCVQDGRSLNSYNTQTSLFFKNGISHYYNMTHVVLGILDDKQEW